MKKCILLSVVLFVLGCNAKTLHQGTAGGDAEGKTVTSDHLATLPAVMIDGFEDQTDYGAGFQVEELDALQQTVTAVAPLAVALGGPAGGAVVGVALTALGLARRHRKVFADAKGFLQVVRGIGKTTSGGKVSEVNAALSANLKEATDEHVKARIKELTT